MSKEGYGSFITESNFECTVMIDRKKKMMPNKVQTNAKKTTELNFFWT